MGDYILMVQLDVPDEHVDEFNRLYDTEHLPHLLEVTGVMSGQRFELDRDGDDQLRFLIIYELENPEIPAGEEWQEASKAPAWLEARKHLTARRRGVFRKI